MQTHLSGEVESALADLRFIRFAGTSVSLTRHHAELTDTCHERFVGIAPLLRSIVGKRGENKCRRQNAGCKEGSHLIFPGSTFEQSGAGSSHRGCRATEPQTAVTEFATSSG